MTHLGLKYVDHDKQECAAHPPAQQLDPENDNHISVPHPDPDHEDHQPAQQLHTDHETDSPRYVHVQQHSQDCHILPGNQHQPEFHSPEPITQQYDSPGYGMFPPAQHSSTPSNTSYDSCTTAMNGVQYDYQLLEYDGPSFTQECLTPTNKGKSYTPQQQSGTNIPTPTQDQYYYDSPTAAQHQSSQDCTYQNSEYHYEILREPQHDTPGNLTECSLTTDDRNLDQSGPYDVLNNSLFKDYAIIEEEDQDDISDNSLESEEDIVEPPSPIFKRDVRVPAVRPTVDSTLPQTPTTRQSVIKPNLDSIFDISSVDLKGKLVQIIDISGDDRKSQVKMKISDGDTWIEVFLDNAYRIYIYGKMLEVNHLVNIVDYTGSIEMDNIVLVST